MNFFQGKQYNKPVSYTNHYSGLAQGTRRSLSRTVRKAQPYKTLSKKSSHTDSHKAVPQVQNEHEQGLPVDEQVIIPSPSRRSSVFEDRSTPLESRSFNDCQSSPVEPRSSLPSDFQDRPLSSLKGKAMMAFGSFRRQSFKRRKEQPVFDDKPSDTIIVITDGEKKRKNRRSLLHFFNPSSSADINDALENHVEPPLKEKRYLPSLGSHCPTSPKLSLSSQDVPSDEKFIQVSGSSKLLRRRSITQIFSRRRSSNIDESDESNSRQVHGCPSPLRKREGSSPNSIKDSHGLANPPSECQQSVSTLSESEVGEDEPKSPVILDRTTEIIPENNPDTPLTNRKPLPLDMEKITDLSNRFSLHIDSNTFTDSPIMELAVQLNSLDFNHLDPGTYSDTNDDE